MRVVTGFFQSLSRDPSAADRAISTIGTFFFGILLFAIALRLLITVGVVHAADAPRATVVRSEIRGTINPATADYLESAITKAETLHAQALVISLDTPGGLVSSVQKMAQAIDRSKVPVVVYVEPAGAAATSAGALLLLASHVSAMTPGSHMGSAHPVDSSGKDIQGAMGEKALNDTSAFAEGLAEVRGRDPKLAAEIVRKSRSFTASEGARMKLVDILADSFPDLLRKLDGRTVKFAGGTTATIRSGDAANVEVIAFEMTFGQKLLHLVSNPNIAAILMTLAMVLIYVELSNPGIQVAGILGVIFLIVGFMCFQTLPIRTGGLALILVGAVALIGEIFVTTHGILGAGGVLAFVLGLVWVIDPSQVRSGVSPAVYVPAGLFLGTTAFLISWFAARTKRDAAAALARMKGGGIGGLEGYVGTVDSLATSSAPGAAALASPFGTLTIRGEIWNFVSEDSVRVGDPVEVVRIDGLKAFVRPIREPKEFRSH
jgi:membrane-bound serine protease (ClpP class)